MWLLIVMAVYGNPSDAISMQEFSSLETCEVGKNWVIKEKAAKVEDAAVNLWSVTCIKK